MSDYEYDPYLPPLAHPIQSIFAMSPLTTLVASGIVNPFGPTLEVLFAEGDVTDYFTIYRLMLNPFRQELLEVGEAPGIDGVLEPGNYIEAECLRGQLETFGTCPTLILDVPAFIPEWEYRLPYHRDFLCARPGAPRVLSALRRHPFDPWQRVQEEMATVGSQSPATNGHSATLSEAEAEEMVEILLDPRHSEPELKAFLYAWSGSISFQIESGNRSLACGALSAEQFKEFFALIHARCSNTG